MTMMFNFTDNYVNDNDDDSVDVMHIFVMTMTIIVKRSRRGEEVERTKR